MRTWSGVRLTIGDICPCICLFMPRILAHPCLGFEPVTVFLILDNSTVLFDGGSCQQRAICVYYVRAASPASEPVVPVSYTHLRAHETRHDLVCRLLLENKKKKKQKIKKTK